MIERARSAALMHVNLMRITPAKKALNSRVLRQLLTNTICSTKIARVNHPEMPT
jgi:hypothetical protein